MILELFITATIDKSTAPCKTNFRAVSPHIHLTLVPFPLREVIVLTWIGYFTHPQIKYS